jgi:anthranilate synthase/aminodeoxychorismate synthase-like glutamine amidotransferase
VRVLFVENHDSFSWNVVETLPVERSAVLVRAGRDVAADPRALGGVDVVVVGPGPTDPLRAGIVDVVRAAAAARLPLLGICLGHQALGLAFGARLTRITPTHGKTSTAVFLPSRLFPGIAGPHEVMRYHSLALADVAPPLRVVAATADGVPMAIEHDTLPLAGLQFHPDSYATPAGRAMVAAFFAAVR